jgi:non-canonical (house-cleaning) NTP pyrophosphatase
MIIAVGATSEIKTQAVEETLATLVPEAQILTLNMGVEEQVFGFDQITQGAQKKAQQALELQKADMGVGVENGLVQIEANGWFDFLCVIAVTSEQKESISFSNGFFIPDWVVNEIKEKQTKLSTIIDRLSAGKDQDPLVYFSNHMLTRRTQKNRFGSALEDCQPR